MRMITDARYKEKEVGRPSAKEIVENPHMICRNNFEFCDTDIRQNVRDVRRYTVVKVRALYNISAEA